MLRSALLLAALVHPSAYAPLGVLALTPSLPLSPRRHTRCSPSALFYASENDSEPLIPLPRPAPSRRRPDGGAKAEESTDLDGRSTRRIPRRAVPHVKNASHTDAAVRAGYIIRQIENVSDEEQQQRQTKLVRPFRRLVHRGRRRRPSGELQQEDQIGESIQVEAPSVDKRRVYVRNRTSNRKTRLSLSNQPQLDEFLDTPEKLQPYENERRGARRVTFKATRVSSKAILSKSVATLTEYMTQPVSQYSLISFHDADGSSANSKRGENGSQPKARRWLVRRLTGEEAQRYTKSSTSERGEDIDESNLFRLAVPLLPLIGWDLTPVIDLEVIPPKIIDETTDSPVRARTVAESGDIYEADPVDEGEWAPLRGIRKRMRSQGDVQQGPDSETADGPPAVKVRSLRVSLLSTQEEVRQVMSNNVRRGGRRDRDMQKEAIGMVSKVEEWLRPHISFEAELSWSDALSNRGIAADESSSTVTVKSTAITSLTIPKIPSDILRATVPSGFLVKRLGATLTSQALAICLPRFLRQLEKDYNRWSGLGMNPQNVELKGSVSEQ